MSIIKENGDLIMQGMEVSVLEGDTPHFETLSHQNGLLYWYASVLIKALGYKDFKITMMPLLKAYQVCVNTGIDPAEHFIRFDNEADGKTFKDIKLTRFACYLVVMNADIKKPNVAKAQTYFAALAASIQQYIIEQEDIKRVDIRGEVSKHENSLAGTVSTRGIQDYGRFKNKGYIGLYNMPLAEIKKRKGLPNNCILFDFMGAEELGANIFRVTQTEAKIKRENIQGQKDLERAAFDVGRTVRKAMEENGSTMPESLPIREDIKHVKSDLKKTNKAFKSRDKIK